MRKFLLFLLAFIPIIGLSQDRVVLLGKVLSDTSSFSNVKISDRCPLKLPPITQSEKLIEIRFYGFHAWNDIYFPTNIYVVITYDKSWDIRTYFYTYTNDTLKFSQKDWRRGGKKYNDIIRTMRPEFIGEHSEFTRYADSIVNMLGLSGFFERSHYAATEELYLNQDTNVIGPSEIWITEGVDIAEYKVGDRFRRFVLNSDLSQKNQDISNMFFKIFMDGKLRE
ncbi:MAG: hypothetical protein LLF93_09475 [Bacteroidales bacterium]|nr:hypothetical protein [Bacteroidales bacterium]